MRTTMKREKENILFSFALFFAIVDWSVLAWWLLPYLLTAIGRKEFWPCYSIGFAFSVIIGGTMVKLLLGNMQERITYCTRGISRHAS